MDKELPANLLKHLRESGTPQKSQDIAKAFSKHVLEVEHCLDLLAEAKLVRYRPTEGVWGWTATEQPEG